MASLKSFLLLLPCYIGLFFMIQLLRGKQFLTELPKKLLFFFMLGVFVFCLAFVLFYNEHYEVFKWFQSSYVALMLLFHPLFYLYVKSLVSGRIKTTEYYLHFSPAIISFIIVSICEFALPLEKSIHYYTHHVMGIEGITDNIFINIMDKEFLLAKKVHAFQAIFYFFAAHILLKNQDNLLKNLFTYGKKYNLRWLITFNFSYAVVALIGIITTLLPSNVADKNSIFMLLNMLVFAFFTLFIGLKGSEQNSAVEEIIERDKSTQLPLTCTENSNSVIDKVEDYMKNQKAYLNPELTIWDIAKNTHINRTYISKAINDKMNMNLSQLVNKYRIENSCELIKSGSKNTLESIAYDSGFNSLSTFKRAFKLNTGKTPTEYRQEIHSLEALK